MVNELDFAWLQEPAAKDETQGPPGEGLFDWLARSTLPRAREARRFLNFNLSELPIACRKGFCLALEARWHSAFFELIVARTLQAVGARVEFEVQTESGTKPDFLAWFGEQGIVVEATSPEFLNEFDNHQRQVGPLKEIIENAVSAEWRVLVHELPDIGASDSKREFNREVTRLLEGIPAPDSNFETRFIEGVCRDGEIRLTLLAQRTPEQAAIAGGPSFAYYSNAASKIRSTVKRKRKQVRSSTDPRILAIDARFGATFSDFDRALFGDGGDKPNGEFMGKGKGEPVWAGILAFPEVGFTCPYEPVFYIHPRFSGRIPDKLDAFECRSVNSDRQILTLPASKKVFVALCPAGPSL